MKSLNRLRQSCLPLLLVPTLLIPVLGTADDTEVFFARAASASNRAANVLFMFDISSSMGNRDGTPLRRIDRLKKSMIDILETTEGINVGIGSFNGVRQGGAILVPATDPNADVCKDLGCDEITLRAPILLPDDDAEESLTGTVTTDSSYLDFGSNSDGSDIVELELEVRDRDDVVQVGTSTVDDDWDGLAMFYMPIQPETAVGLRFEKIDIPVGATIVSAVVEFRSRENGASGEPVANISIDASDHNGDGSPRFSENNGFRVTDRPRLAPIVEWSNIDFTNTGGVVIETPDLSALIEARIAQPDWQEGKSIALLFESGTFAGDRSSNYRAFKSADGGDAPKLTIRYTMTAPAVNKVGLRFADLDIPRGAKINHAYLELTPADTHTARTEVRVRAQAIGHAPGFAAVSGNIGSRTPTIADVDWVIDPFENTKYEELSSDLASVVQEVVNRPDWCGGNALAMVLEGTGIRIARSRDYSEFDAPALNISYDPSTVVAGATCTRGIALAAIQGDADDAEENASVVTTTNAVLDPVRNGTDGVIGLRFRDLDVPSGATISSAYLKLVTAATDSEDLVLDIRVQPTANAAHFDASSASDISGRTASTTGVKWSVPEVSVGTRVTSSDFGSSIQTLVNSGGWTPGTPMVVTLQRQSGAGVRQFETFEEGKSVAARLQVRYQQESTGTELPVLRTAREHMLDTVLGFRHRSGTPLLDSYHESALYMLGEPVDYGATRGSGLYNDRYNRISAETTYTGGTVVRPPDCTDVNPNAVACLDEKITGNPIYTAPEVGSCQANQIVLLSDGSATQGDSVSRIQSLTGLGSCAHRYNDHEICGVELADWLYKPSATSTRSPVITHTIGFNFSNDFLRDVAAAGGGRFQTASTASELSRVFRVLIDDAAEIDTSFVAPAATVSQYNRFANREDVYFAMFKPSLNTRWDGNLKRYRLSTHPTTGEIAFFDAVSTTPILDETTGAIRNSAKSYWTTGDPDGPEVAAGGAANEFALPRNVLTYIDDVQGDGSVARNLVALHENTAAIDAAVLGISPSDTAHRESLLKWARGVDVLDVDGDNNKTEVRHQMGDPMHSTPFIFNYDTNGSTVPKSVIFVGTNEGYLHGINTENGGEVFGFVPPELLRNLNKFYQNKPGTDRPYGLDGPINGYHDDTDKDGLVDSNETAIVFVGMRRGGRNYYALDVSNPLSPSVAWVIKGGEGDFAELGQSWSRPVSTTMIDGSVERDVLVFGGGYDAINDTRDTRNGAVTVTPAVPPVVSGQSDSMGRAIYIVNAQSGEYITHLSAPAQSDMRYAIPSQVNVVDIDLDGLADMMWVGDMGGQLWRFDVEGRSGASIAGSISGAVVGEFGSVGTRANRRFFYPPDIALVEDDGKHVFMNVGIGSGWRAHPLDDVVEDRYYMLRVEDIYNAPRDADGALDYDRLTESDLYDVTSSSVRDDTTGKSANGWYLTFGSDGEKVLSSSVTVNGKVFFTTYLPDVLGNADDCSVSVGGGRLYALDAVYGSAVFNLDETGGEAISDLTRDDRSKPLDLPGLPPAVEVFIPKSAPDEVAGSVGASIFETKPGAARRRTYWAEQ